MVLISLFEGFTQEPNHRNGDLSRPVACIVVTSSPAITRAARRHATEQGGYNAAKRRASSRRLIFPRSVTGIASTIKTRFGTCQPLNSRLQNSNS